MNRSMWIAATALPALLALAACKPRPIPQADQDKIRAADANFVQAMNRGDVDALVAMYTSDADVLAPGSPPVSGSAGIKAMLSGMMGPMKINLQLTPVKVVGTGDVAYVVGNYRLAATMKDSTQPSPPPEDGKYVEVYRWQPDGSWKIAVDIWNPNQMPPAPMPAVHKR